MEAVGLALALVATIDLCLKYGAQLVKACENYQDAEAKIAERVLRVKNCWHRTHIQLDFIKQVHRDLDDDFVSLQLWNYQVLSTKLQAAERGLTKLRNSKLDRREPSRFIPDLNKFQFVRTKQCLDEAIEELEAWQKTFDPSWYLLLKITKPSIGWKLTRCAPKAPLLSSAKEIRDSIHATTNTSIFLPDDRLNAAEVELIRCSSVQCVREPRSGRCHLVDSIPYEPEANLNTVTKDVRSLAQKLHSIEPSQFRILQCRGVVRNIQDGKVASFEFVFRPPPDSSKEPTSLRALIGSEIKHSLTERLLVAQQLARSVCSVHTLGFVHKGIRPEAVLGFEDDKSALGSMYLFGFDRFRNAEGATRRVGDAAWERDLYRHPDRQGIHPEEDYIMQHDIYSLGVCLLEIGLWTSFVSYDPADGKASPSPSLPVFADDSIGRHSRQVKEKLVEHANDHLAVVMGDRYRDVVINCLTCLDEDNTDFADQSEFEDVDGVSVGVRYIEKVLLRLEDIRL